MCCYRVEISEVGGFESVADVSDLSVFDFPVPVVLGLIC